MFWTRRDGGAVSVGGGAGAGAGAVVTPRLTRSTILSRTSGSTVLSWFFTSMPCFLQRPIRSMVSQPSSRASAKMRTFSFCCCKRNSPFDYLHTFSPGHWLLGVHTKTTLSILPNSHFQKRDPSPSGPNPFPAHPAGSPSNPRNRLFYSPPAGGGD